MVFIHEKESDFIPDAKKYRHFGMGLYVCFAGGGWDSWISGSTGSNLPVVVGAMGRHAVCCVGSDMPGNSLQGKMVFQKRKRGFSFFAPEKGKRSNISGGFQPTPYGRGFFPSFIFAQRQAHGFLPDCFLSHQNHGIQL